MKRMSRLSNRETPSWDVMNEPADEWMSDGIFLKTQLKRDLFHRELPWSSKRTQPHTPRVYPQPFYFYLSLITPWNDLTCLSIPRFLPAFHILDGKLCGAGIPSASLTAPPADRRRFVQRIDAGQSECVPLKGSLLLAAVRKEKHVQICKFWGWEELGGWYWPKLGLGLGLGYTLLMLCIKQITNESLLYSTGNWTQCSVGPEWEGSPKGGDVCISDSFCCTVKTNTTL